MNILDPVTNPKILSLLLTRQCTAQCEHCGTHSGPKVKGRLPRIQAEQLIWEAHALSYDAVVFTGGEATLYGEDLYALIELAYQLALPTRIVTNAHWAKDLNRASSIVHRLKASGLCEINFSTGDQHARFVPLTNIIWGIRAALDADMPVGLMIEVLSERLITKADLLESTAFKNIIHSDEIHRITISESPWMPLDEAHVAEYPPGLTTNADNIGRRLGCDSVINTMTVMPDGKMMACCGLGTLSIPELEVGHVDRDRLATVRQRAEDDFLKRWIRNEGPERILQWAAEKNPDIHWENMYAHRCQACKRQHTDPLVRSEIESHYEEKVLDVLYSEWLLHH